MLYDCVYEIKKIKKIFFNVSNSWKTSIFKMDCRLLCRSRVEKINLSFGKIVHILNSRMYNCHHDIIPEVTFAVNT